MKLYSLENTKMKNGLYDLFYPMMIDIKIDNDQLSEYIVYKEREMRMDLICIDIYNSTEYMDELMHINGILDPYSVKEGDIIYYPDLDTLLAFQNKYENLDEDFEKSNLKNDGNELTTSSPGENFTPIMIDKDNRSIIINNKLK